MTLRQLCESHFKLKSMGAKTVKQMLPVFKRVMLVTQEDYVTDITIRKNKFCLGKSKKEIKSRFSLKPLDRENFDLDFHRGNCW